jgi:phthalate 4,5-dioxygenase
LRENQSYVRISPFVLPAFSIVPGPATAKFDEKDSRAFRFWIPIDDVSTWFYILTMRDTPFSDDERASARSWVDSRYRRIRNAGNRYLQDREIQKTRSYSGIQAVIPAEQDGCATESMGPIYDRTKEHLGYSDKTIIALRKVLLQAARAVKEEREPPHIVRDPKLNDFSRLRAVKGILPANGSWRELLVLGKERP